MKRGLLIWLAVGVSSASATETCANFAGVWSGVCKISGYEYESELKAEQTGCESVQLNESRYKRGALEAEVITNEILSLGNNRTLHWMDNAQSLVITETFWASYPSLEESGFNNSLSIEKTALSLKAPDQAVLTAQYYEVGLNGADIQPDEKVNRDFLCEYKRSTPAN